MNKTPFHLRFYYTCYAARSLLLGLLLTFCYTTILSLPLSTLLTSFTTILHLFIVFIPLRSIEYSATSLFSPKIITRITIIAIIDLIPSTLWLIIDPNTETVYALLTCLLLYTLPLIIFAQLASKIQHNNTPYHMPPITLEPSTWQWCRRLITNLILLSLIIGIIYFIIHEYLYLLKKGQFVLVVIYSFFFIIIYLEQTALLITDRKYARQAQQHKSQAT